MLHPFGILGGPYLHFSVYLFIIHVCRLLQAEGSDMWDFIYDILRAKKYFYMSHFTCIILSCAPAVCLKTMSPQGRLESLWK